MNASPVRAMVLAAGQGTRLKPWTNEKPKCLVEVCGQTILDRALDAFERAGVLETVVVIGFMAGAVRARLASRAGPMRVRCIENLEYATTNSMFSLLLGLRDCAEACWILEGDVILDDKILRIPDSGSFCWYADAYRPDMDGAFLVRDENSRAKDVLILSPQATLPVAASSLRKSIGLLRLNQAAAGELRCWLESGVLQGKRNVYYDLIVKEQLAQWPVTVVDVLGLPWCEVDTPGDLTYGERLFGIPR